MQMNMLFRIRQLGRQQTSGTILGYMMIFILGYYEFLLGAILEFISLEWIEFWDTFG